MKRIALVLTLLVAAVPFVVAQPANLEKDKANLAKLEGQYKVAKTAYIKKPKDTAAKKKYVVATVAFGNATMYSGTLKPREKYSGALRLYREALKFDPKNSEALKNKKMIEDIYRSMGREIPK